MRYDDTEHPRHTEQLRHTKHLQCFNTLKLFILSKSMKFLSQPAVVQILDRIYSSEIMVNEQREAVCSRQPHRHKASGLRAAAALARDFGGVPKRTDGLGLHRRVP